MWCMTATAMVAAHLMRTYRVWLVAGRSCEPALLQNSLIVVRRLARRSSRSHPRLPTRGELALFRMPHSNRVAVKRVFGVPGDTIPASGQTTPFLRRDAIRLDEEQFFMIGDNRACSIDSRHFGAVRSCDIVGVVTWPKVPHFPVELGEPACSMQNAG